MQPLFQDPISAVSPGGLSSGSFCGNPPFFFPLLLFFLLLLSRQLFRPTASPPPSPRPPLLSLLSRKAGSELIFPFFRFALRPLSFLFSVLLSLGGRLELRRGRRREEIREGENGKRGKELFSMLHSAFFFFFARDREGRARLKGPSSSCLSLRHPPSLSPSSDGDKKTEAGQARAHAERTERRKRKEKGEGGQSIFWVFFPSSLSLPPFSKDFSHSPPPLSASHTAASFGFSLTHCGWPSPFPVVSLLLRFTQKKELGDKKPINYNGSLEASETTTEGCVRPEKGKYRRKDKEG